MYELHKEESYIWYDKYLPKLYIPIRIPLLEQCFTNPDKVWDMIMKEKDNSKPETILVAVYEPTKIRKKIDIIFKEVYKYQYIFKGYKRKV